VTEVLCPAAQGEAQSLGTADGAMTADLRARVEAARARMTAVGAALNATAERDAAALQGQLRAALAVANATIEPEEQETYSQLQAEVRSIYSFIISYQIISYCSAKHC
jgi:hypothetical protein